NNASALVCCAGSDGPPDRCEKKNLPVMGERARVRESGRWRSARPPDSFVPSFLRDRIEPIAKLSIDLPSIIRADLSSPPVARRYWQATIAPAYLGLFAWAPFFDQLWLRDIPRSTNLTPLFGSAIGAPILCYLLFYYAPASWGFRAGRPLSVVAA